MVSDFLSLKPNFRMSYFVFSIFVKNEKWNLETHISIFSDTLKRKRIRAIRAPKPPFKISKFENQKSTISQFFQNQFEKNCENFLNFQIFQIWPNCLI